MSSATLSRKKGAANAQQEQVRHLFFNKKLCGEVGIDRQRLSQTLLYSSTQAEFKDRFKQNFVRKESTTEVNRSTSTVLRYGITSYLCRQVIFGGNMVLFTLPLSIENVLMMTSLPFNRAKVHKQVPYTIGVTFPVWVQQTSKLLVATAVKGFASGIGPNHFPP